MEPDLVLEVPDTPDRLAKLVNMPSGQPVHEEAFKAEANPPSSHQNMDHSQETFASHQRNLDGRNLSISSTTHDTNHLFRQARLAHLLSEAQVIDKKPLAETPLELRQNGASTGNQEGVKGDDSNHSDPLNISYFRRCGDSRRKMEKELATRKGEFLGCRRNCKFLGVGSSLPPLTVGRPRSRSEVSVSQKEKAISLEDTHIDVKSREKGKGIDLFSDSKPKTGQELSNIMDQKPLRQKRLVRNGCISPNNIARASVQSKVHYQHGMTSYDVKSLPSTSGIGCIDNLVEIDSSKESQLRHRNRRLVESCSNSQTGTTESKSDTDLKKDGIEKAVFTEVPNGILCCIQNTGPNSKDGHGDTNKGKVIADDMTRGQVGNATLPSTRLFTRAQVDLSNASDADGDILGSQYLGWRRTHSQTENANGVLSSESVCIRKTGQSSNCPLGHCNEVKRETLSHVDILLDNPERAVCHGSNLTSVQKSSNWDFESRRKGPIGGKRKYNLSSNSCESSTSALDDYEVSYLGTSLQSSNLRSSRTRNSLHHALVLRPAIEIDGIHSPETTGNCPQVQGSGDSVSSNATARQIVSDESLARQLQEEFYNESPGRRNREEIEEAIALTFQQEENNQHSSVSSRRARALARFRQVRNSRIIAQYRSRPLTRIARLLRDIDLGGMDNDMRLNFFEELESEFNNRIALSHILHSQRDFNENDYEALLALDENNHQHSGASENQINNLPQSMVQTDSVEEPCAVCLEKPSFGDTIRHLPCLHKFHKDCIDQWLRIKTSCPICKCGLT